MVDQILHGVMMIVLGFLFGLWAIKALIVPESKNIFNFIQTTDTEIPY